MHRKNLSSRQMAFWLAAGFLAVVLIIGAVSMAQAKSGLIAGQDSKCVPLFTAVGAERPGNDAVAPQASRYRAVALNPLLAEKEGVAVGDRIYVSAFDGESAIGTVDRVGTDVNGVVAVRARILGSEGYLLLSSENGRSLGRLVLPERREFEISCLEGGPAHILEEFAPGARVALPGGEPLVPPAPAAAGPAVPPVVQAPHPTAVVTIDCLIVYTPAARDYANADTSINTYISQAMQLAQLGMDNSAVEITMRLVHSALITYTESGSSNTDLNRLTQNSDGYMDEVHTWRNTYGADLVHLITKVEDTGGLGWLLNTTSGSAAYAFCLGRVQQISWTTTTVHEWGHNMGCHHRKDQTTQPGPGLYSYSAGWRWIGSDSKRYCSIMSYNDSWDGNYVYGKEYFSNPNINHLGAPTGHAVDGDNARNLREIKSVIAAYRNPALLISGTIKVGTTPLANVVLSGFSDTVITDASGVYSGAVTSGYTGTITPVLAGYTFIPASRAYTNVTANQTGQDYAATAVPTPIISLSKTSLNFGALAGGVATAAQSVVVSNSGVGTLNWTAASSQSWLGVTPATGTGTGVLQITVNPAGLAAGLTAGAYSGALTVSAAGASNSPQTIRVNLTVYATGTSGNPFGEFATPADGTTGVTGAIPVTGWVLDDIEVTQVEVKRNPHASDPSGAVGPDGLVFIGYGLFVAGARPDVEAAYPGHPFNYRAGWGYMLLTNFLPLQGNGTFVVHAFATDKDGHRFLLGSKTITCANAAAVKPFGTLDTPAQGGDASGAAFPVFGWVLTPMPKTVAKDGSKIDVYVDSVKMGNLSTAPNVYNQYRVDVSTLFPGLNNTGGPGAGQGGPVGAFFLNTTTYTNAVHTIYWIATDDQGQADGIGSRYFTILNAAAAEAASAKRSERAVEEISHIASLGRTSVSIDPVRAKTGFGPNARAEILMRNLQGSFRTSLRESELVEIDLGGGTEFRGYLAAGQELRPLPIGSTLDGEQGTFAWLPGPGFLGAYDLVFIKKDASGLLRKIPMTIVIRPKFEKR